MLEKLNKFIKLARKQYEQDNIDFNKLEEAIAPIISSDDFEKLPDSIKNEIYYIDMHEVENPTPQQVVESVDLIEKNLANIP